MVKTDKQRLKDVSSLLRRGGRLLGEPCSRCGGVLIQYHGRTFCSNCDDINTLEKTPLSSPVDVVFRLKNLTSIKIEEVARQLEGEMNTEKQMHLAELLLKYIDMLEKVSGYEKAIRFKKDR